MKSAFPTRVVRWCAVALSLAGAAWASGLPFGFVHHGNFERMVRGGDTAGQVDLAALPQSPGAWGLGATGGLKGEVVQIDGRLLVSPGSDPQGRVREPGAGEQAVLFAGARVQSWREVAVPRDMDQAAFEAFVEQQARAAGLAPDQPFVFRVEGRFPHLLWHVVTGEPGQGGHTPHGGRDTAGAHGAATGHGAPMGHGTAAGPGGGHANQRSGMRLFHQPGAVGQLVGVYSGVSLEGVVSHPGERFHLHYADPAATVSGHVDRYGVAAGAVLRLPAH